MKSQKLFKLAPVMVLLAAGFTAALSGTAIAQELKIALIAGKTGALEAYAKETETGFMMGLEYLTAGKMEINGRKIKVIVKDDQGKPDIGRTMLAEVAQQPEREGEAVGVADVDQRVQEVGVGVEERQQCGGGQGRPSERQDDLGEDPQLGGPVHLRRLR